MFITNNSSVFSSLAKIWDMLVYMSYDLQVKCAIFGFLEGIKKSEAVKTEFCFQLRMM